MLDAAKDDAPATGMHHLLGMAAPVVAVLLVFGRAAGFEFVFWDDDINILMNERIRAASVENLVWMFTDFSYALRYQPLSWVGWLLDHMIWGLDPRGYHLSALALHAACAGLAYAALRKVVEQAMIVPPLSGRLVLLLSLAAVFWAVHPLRAEVAAWVTGRRYSQTMLFLLVSWLLDPGGWPVAGSPRRDSWRLAVSAAAFACALLTYPLTLEWPVVLAMIDWARWRASGGGGFPWRVWALRRAPVFILAAGILLLNLSGRYFAPGEWGEPLTLEAFPLTARLKQAAYVLWVYLAETALPWNLSIVYPRLDKMDPSHPIFTLSIALLIVMTVALSLVASRWRWPLACWAAYVALMFTKLGWTEWPHYANDRYVHIAAPVVSLALFRLLVSVDAVLTARPSARRALSAVAAVIMCAYAIAAFRQGGVWRDSETLLATASERLGPHEYQSEILWRLGRVRETAGDMPGALQAFSDAVSATPRDSRARYYRARVLVALNRPGEAVDDLFKVLETKEDPNIRFQLGDLLMKLGRTDEALAELRAAAEAQPENSAALLRIGILLEARRDYPGALAALEQAARLAPEDAAIAESLARVRARAGARQ